ncbi:MAG: AAA family ATPase [Thermodesulfobacteriota bacterium]
MEKNIFEESLQGIVDRVTYHNEVNGWSVLKVKCYNVQEPVTVTVHQTRVFAGATMKFTGTWTNHAKYGRQFKANQGVEQKPASAAGLEKYLGSGLIKGVGPKTAKRIVAHFGKRTLTVFEEKIEELLHVPGIAEKKLAGIRDAWEEHRAVREVMIFLQGHGISTLFAVRIYKKYGDEAISLVTENPYRLANDFYGIGFFSADKVALSIGFEPDSQQRIVAAIRHILAASRDQGHCYLSRDQIQSQIMELLDLDLTGLLETYLQLMELDGNIKVRRMEDVDGQTIQCYYSKSLYFDELNCAKALLKLNRGLDVDTERVQLWLERHQQKEGLQLSDEQRNSVAAIVSCGCSILTGGPGCGKTTATKTLVQLLQAMGNKVVLAAPTGRAAQRMGEVIGLEAKTIHRLLEFQGIGFRMNRDQPLSMDCLIVDECSMLDISLAASLLEAIPENGQLVLIGDKDQLPSVGAGNVLGDLMACGKVPCFTLTQVFRQAAQSSIIRYAHEINQGTTPRVHSPFKSPSLWQEGEDCLFLDSSEATIKQLSLIRRAKQHLEESGDDSESLFGREQLFFPTEDVDLKNELRREASELHEQVNFGILQTAETSADELRSVLKKVHPWSSLYYGLTATQVVERLYTEWIPKYYPGSETQLLSPMTRGGLGTINLNTTLQQKVNPPEDEKGQIVLGERILRKGDRVIHRRNNYTLGVFNGDIGTICSVNPLDVTLTVRFFGDGREVEYQRDEISELDLAYAITIHKSQGSEFDCVIIPILNQHFKMLFRNLIYTGLTRAKKLAVFVGTRQAFAMAVRNGESAKRQTSLAQLLSGELSL